MKRRDIVKRLNGIGEPTGPPLEVMRVDLDAVIKINEPSVAVAYLHDGSWELVEKLSIVGFAPLEGVTE